MSQAKIKTSILYRPETVRASDPPAYVPLRIAFWPDVELRDGVDVLWRPSNLAAGSYTLWFGDEPVPCGGGTKQEIVDAVVRVIKGFDKVPDYLSEIEIEGNRLTFSTQRRRRGFRTARCPSHFQSDQERQVHYHAGRRL
jgi:hypothetical protein